jgi:hypothetical protein
MLAPLTVIKRAMHAGCLSVKRVFASHRTKTPARDGALLDRHDLILKAGLITRALRSCGPSEHPRQFDNPSDGFSANRFIFNMPDGSDRMEDAGCSCFRRVARCRGPGRR